MLPVLYQSHNLILYSYPLLMGLGWGVAYQVFFSKIDENYSKIMAQVFFWGAFIFVWVGAKLLFYFTAVNNSADIIQQMSFWTGGGFVFYGGFTGGLLYIGLFKLWDKNFNFNVWWPAVPALALGHGLGRIGCFLAGCCFGKPTDLWWGIYLHHHLRHPTQLIEATGLFLIAWYLLRSRLPRIILVSRYLIFYGALRFAVELLRGDSIRGQWGSLSPSQWISLGLICSGVALVFRYKFNNLEKSN